MAYCTLFKKISLLLQSNYHGGAELSAEIIPIEPDADNAAAGK